MKLTPILVVLFLTLAPLAWSVEKAPSASKGLVDAGNKFCPVSGDKVSGKHFVEYQGKKYGLCCKMCAGKFNKNPEKYLTEMAQQESGEGEASSHHHEHMH